MITIFTPTYNRKHLLPKLYESLKRQTQEDFEWLVVDDGSTDGTEMLIQAWQKEKCIDINYIKIQNGGKANAINVGLKNANGEIFFIVDSDDYISDDCVELILQANESVPEERKEMLAGFCFRKKNYSTGEDITVFPENISKFENELDLAFKYKAGIDKAEIFYTEVLKKFPFPQIPGSKFVPEALVWYRIAHAGYYFMICDKPVYMCDYLEDGYTKNFKSNLKKNCRGFKLYYKECLSYPEIPLMNKIKYFIRFMQCKFYEVKS